MCSKNIENTVKDLKNKGYTVLYIAAFGSYNYGLETRESDFDMKAVVYINEIDLYKNPKSHSIVKYHFGECEVLNVYEFGEKLSNFDLPYLEILFSKINYINPDFDIEEIRFFVNEVLIKNRTYFGNEILRVMEKIKKMFANAMFDFKGKKTYNVIRLYNLFVKFNGCKRYEECLRVGEEDVDKFLMIKHKSGNITKDDAINDCNEYISRMKIYLSYHGYVESSQLRVKINNRILNVMEKMKNKLAVNEEREVVRNRLSFSNGVCVESRRWDMLRMMEEAKRLNDDGGKNELMKVVMRETGEVKKLILVLHSIEFLIFGCFVMYVVLCALV